MSESNLRALLEKYLEMAALRADYPAPAVKKTAVGEHRSRLQVLAQAFPGALRQLETFPLLEIENRIAALRLHLEQDAPAPVFGVIEVRYHEELKSELTQRGSNTKSMRVLQRLAVEFGSSRASLEAIIFDRATKSG